MANFITNGINNLFNMIAMGIVDNISQRINSNAPEIDEAVNYRRGEQPKPLNVKAGQHDDNVTINLSGIVVDKTVSAILGDKVKFDLPGDEDSPEQEYINKVMEANRSEIFLYNACVAAADGGTGFIKIMPDMTNYKGVTYPRLDVINPTYITMFTMPHDNNMVWKYVIQYEFSDVNDKKAIRRETTEQQADSNNWLVTTEEYSEATGWRFEQIDEPVVWDWEFPPIVHWQNLPNPYGAEGEPDLTKDVRIVQDKFNEVASNNAKIIRIYTHPMRYLKGVSGIDRIEVGPTDMPGLGDTGDIIQLPAIGDLAGSLAYQQFLKRELFNITRTVDIESIYDKIGTLTNFGLKVMYQDMLAKINTKRQLFGDALLELIHRLLALNNMPADEAGVIIWDDVLPVNEKEVIETLKMEVELGTVSVETAATELGRVYKTADNKGEFDKIQEEKRLEQTNRSNLGSFLLDNFETR
jgi:hypothetical protein